MATRHIIKAKSVGLLAIVVLVGCQGQNRVRLWPQTQPGTVYETYPYQNRSVPGFFDGYQPVEEYSIPTPSPDSAYIPHLAPEQNTQSSVQVPMRSISRVPQKDSRYSALGSNSRPQVNAANGPAFGNLSLSEPIETQQKLVLQPTRKRGLWEKIGDGFWGLFALSRGRKTVRQKSEYGQKRPMQPAAVAVASGGRGPIAAEPQSSRRVTFPGTAFPLPESSSVQQTSRQIVKSGRSPHWSEFPAREGTPANYSETLARTHPQTRLWTNSPREDKSLSEPTEGSRTGSISSETAAEIEMWPFHLTDVVEAHDSTTVGSVLNDSVPQIEGSGHMPFAGETFSTGDGKVVKHFSTEPITVSLKKSDSSKQ